MEREKIWGGGRIKKIFDPPPKKEKKCFPLSHHSIGFRREIFLIFFLEGGGMKKTKGGWTKINYFEISRNFTNPN